MFLAVSSASPLLLAGCGSAAHPSATITASPAPAIVSGTVRIYGGPMLRDGKMAMNGNPMQAVAPLVVKQAGRVFRRATTSAQGRFRLSLPAGTYVISAGCSQPATVVLRVGEIMTRDLACDVP
jgi:hypothetical protein